MYVFFGPSLAFSWVHIPRIKNSMASICYCVLTIYKKFKIVDTHTVHSNYLYTVQISLNYSSYFNY